MENFYASRVQPYTATQAKCPVPGNLLCASLLLGVFGCGAAPPVGGDPLFRAIQRDEARLDLAVTNFQRARACLPAESAREEGCSASQAICDKARASGDADAMRRCFRAHDACVGLRARTQQRCGDS